MRKSATLMLLILIQLVAPSSASDGLPLGGPFIVAVGEKVLVGDLPIVLVFDRVLMDSRCPAGGFCFWEGEGTVQLSLSLGEGDATSVELHTPRSPLGDGSVVFEQHRVTLRELSPYPKLDRPVDPLDYELELVVDKVSRVVTGESSWSTWKASFR